MKLNIFQAIVCVIALALMGQQCCEQDYYPDVDGDGYGNADVTPVSACPGQEPVGFVTDNTDCNDVDPEIHPGAEEKCDGRDSDCDPTTTEKCSWNSAAWNAATWQ